MEETIPSFYYVIFATSFFTAAISAVAGMFGGTLLLAVLAQYLRMEVLIPVHGLIQLWSNGTRAVILRRSILWSIVREAAIGVLIGGVAGRFFVMSVPETTFSLAMGIFILLITLMPKIPLDIPFPGKWVIFGLISILLGLFFGAVGTFMGAVFLAQKISKNELVATQAANQTMVHFVKVAVYTWIGFQISEWMVLLAGAWLLTIAGTWVGTRLLARVPEEKFRVALKVIISLLAVRLIWTGVRGI